MMYRVGLTGGIASGKTMVADIFAELGAGVVDTDRVAREVVAPGQPGLEAVRGEFGAGVLRASGELDRQALREVIFADPAARRTLESLLHPLIRACTLKAIGQLRAPYAVAVVPLLVETGFGELVDRIAVVDCPRGIQIERLMERDGIGLAQAKAMLSAQAGRPPRRAAGGAVEEKPARPAAARPPGAQVGGPKTR
ncbi:MAG: dephospho-CoA kinase, partial [Rhodospirillales bacterium]|nr:dephospho-CoA kinase [Rhodospirillales bacterium]